MKSHKPNKNSLAWNSYGWGKYESPKDVKDFQEIRYGQYSRRSRTDFTRNHGDVMTPNGEAL